MFGFSKKEKEADAICVILDMFMSRFKRAIWRVLSGTGERYDEWHGSGWDERYIVVMSAYAHAVGQQGGSSSESVSLALKSYCKNKALSGRGEAMYHRTVDSNLLTHYEHLFAYVYELANVVRLVQDGSGGVKLGCITNIVDIDTVMDVFVEKYFKFAPLVAEFKPKSARRGTP